jgi:hypothetical protein
MQVSNTKFHVNLSSGSRSDTSGDRQTDMTQLIGAFRAFMPVPNETKHMREETVVPKPL